MFVVNCVKFIIDNHFGLRGLNKDIRIFMSDKCTGF